MSLRTEVYGLLDNARRLCVEVPEAAALAQMLTELRNRLDTPLRVAVVGDIKAGKSTFMNALMDANLVYTGTEETTYTVCWFRYSETPSLTVCFRNGEQIPAAFEDLKKWSVRSYEKENPRIHDVKYLIIHYPSEVLRTIEFVDTPGLNSVYGTDAQNTLDFLAIKSSEDTLSEAGNADAVIFAFERTLTDHNRKTLTKFHGSEKGSTSPINSVGIFTKLDGGGAWFIDEDNCTPVEKARARTCKFMENPEIKRLLFTMLPVCAKPSEGFRQLESGDWELLRLLAQKDRDALREILSDAGEFKRSTDEYYMEFGKPEARGPLIDKLAAYGILEVTDQLRTGKTPAEIGAALYELCGIRAVRQLVNRHFGNRTFLIKTQYIFNQLSSMIYQIQYNPDSSRELKEIAGHIKDEVDRLMSALQTLKELKALQMYYSGQLEILADSEQDDLLRVSGEYGRLPEERLGVPNGSTISDMAAFAQKKANQWNAKASNSWMMPGTYIEVAAIVARSYELIHYHLSALIEE